MELWSYIKPIGRLVEEYGKRLGQLTLGVLIFYLWAPIAVIVIQSFAEEGVFSFPPEQLSLRWYQVFLQDQSAHDALLTSVKVAIPVTIITVGIAILLSLAITRYKFRGRQSLQIISVLPMIVPLVVTGVALVLFFGLIGLQLGFQSIFVAHVVRTLPFASLIILASLLSFDRTLEEASKDLGADELRTFRKVTLPNLLPGIIAAALITFTLSFNEFVYTFFVRSSTTATLPTFLWGTIRHNVTPEVNVIGIIFLLVAIVMILLAVSISHINRIAIQE
jgi:spermidine/putrescine transport system permease protein